MLTDGQRIELTVENASWDGNRLTVNGSSRVNHDGQTLRLRCDSIELSPPLSKSEPFRNQTVRITCQYVERKISTGLNHKSLVVLMVALP